MKDNVKKKNKRKKYYFALLVLLLLGISFGYAFLTTSLNMKGTAVINASDWLIQLQNVKVTEGSVVAENPTINTEKTEVSYTVTLTNPGDFYEFTIDAYNAGSIDGMISTISSKLNDEEITTLPDYLSYSVTYADDIVPVAKHKLGNKETATYKVRVEFLKDITVDQLPEESQTFNFNFGVTYVQADDTAMEVPSI